MITSRGGMGKGRPEVQQGGSAGSFWPSAAKAGKNAGFSVRARWRVVRRCPAAPGAPQPWTPSRNRACAGLGSAGHLRASSWTLHCVPATCSAWTLGRCLGPGAALETTGTSGDRNGWLALRAQNQCQGARGLGHQPPGLQNTLTGQGRPSSDQQTDQPCQCLPGRRVPEPRRAPRRACHLLSKVPAPR